MADIENNTGAAPEQSGYVLSREEVKRRNRRSLAIALSIGVFMVLVFAVTFLRLSASVAERSL